MTHVTYVFDRFQHFEVHVDAEKCLESHYNEQNENGCKNALK